MYCIRCDINWARLESQDGEGEETYEFCPKCRSATHLEPQQAGPKYIINGAGEVVDSFYGIPKTIQAPSAGRYKVWKETLTEFKDRRGKAQEDWLERYQKLCETMDRDEALAQCPREKVERLFVWSDEIDNQ